MAEVFDGAGVSFVSVTQAFNTTSSMGRLTLNGLLSFAQFEREVTAERIRDKFGASKPKGMWSGGARQETRRWANNRAENSHLPFRRREQAMLRFRLMRSLQKVASIQASVDNLFNQERSLTSRAGFKANGAAALAEWRGLCAEQGHRPPAMRGLVRICLPAPTNRLLAGLTCMTSSQDGTVRQWATSGSAGRPRPPLRP